MQDQWLRLEGRSMEYFLREGDLVSVEWKNPGPDFQPKIGELLLAKEGELWIIHRLIRVENGRYILKGDASYKMEHLGAQQIWGRIHAWKDSESGKIRPIHPIFLDRIISILSALHLRKIAKTIGYIRRCT